MQEKEEKITFFNERDKSLNDALMRLMLRGKAAIAASKACEYICFEVRAGEGWLDD